MLRAKIRILFLTALLVPGILIGAVKGNAVQTAAGKSLQQDNVVISEFRTRGPAGGSDEFIEVFNPTNSPIDISNWEIWESNSTGRIGTTPTYTFPDGIVIQPGQHFLVANTSSSGYSGTVPPDGTYTSGITDTGGIALTLPDDTPVDQVGMSPNSAFKEGTALSPLSGDLDQSFERGPGGSAGNCSDIDDNAADFQLLNPTNPQNSSSPLTTGCLPKTPTPTQTGTTTSTPTASGSPTSTGTPTDTATPTGTATSTGTPTSTSTATNTPTPTGSTTATSTATPTSTSTTSPTMTATPSAPPHLVISEFRTLGPNGADDEFVELYNPSGAAVNMGGWMVKKSSSCGTSVSTLVTIPANTILQAGQHYLAATSSSSVTSADQTYADSLADDGGLALVTASSTVVDQVGMCASTTYREGIALSPLSGTSNQSYERKPGGATSCFDTDNNTADFAPISPANPQNKASPIVMCAGVLTSTPTSTPTRTPTRTPTHIPTILPGDVVINEFLPHPHTDWNGDGTATTGDEYIEIIYMGTESISLKNWKLDNGYDSSSPYTLPNVTLLPHQIAVFYHSDTGISLSDGGSTVRLLKPDGRTADIQTYPAVTTADQTWCHLPDGSGTWAFACLPTPGKPNTAIRSGTPMPGSTPKAGGANTEPACLIDSVPQSILSAECNSPGTKMWGETGDGTFWLVSRWKWNVFVE